MRPKIFSLVGPIIAISLLLIFVSSAQPAESDRPIRWATPIQMPGVGSFYKITDYLYRSEQPTEEGMKNLTRMGNKDRNKPTGVPFRCGQN